MSIEKNMEPLYEAEETYDEYHTSLLYFPSKIGLFGIVKPF